MSIPNVCVVLLLFLVVYIGVVVSFLLFLVHWK